jgi:hypothetical protein
MFNLNTKKKFGRESPVFGVVLRRERRNSRRRGAKEIGDLKNPSRGFLAEEKEKYEPTSLHGPERMEPKRNRRRGAEINNNNNHDASICWMKKKILGGSSSCE